MSSFYVHNLLKSGEKTIFDPINSVIDHHKLPMLPLEAGHLNKMASIKVFIFLD